MMKFNVLRCFCFVIILIIDLPSSIKAQLTTSTALTPTQLVQNILLGGGITASNITYNGGATAIGSFIGATSNIGLAAGVILASGSVSVADGANNSGSLSNGGSGLTSTDPDLVGIATNTLHDATILEFDFIPTSDTIKFKYVFGSEEYMEFANSSFNDVFGFFITGINPAGGNYTSQNIALIPGTSTPVSINNVNATSNPSYYFDNEIPAGLTVQYDGFTIPLTAISPVQCGTSYHIKLAIADAGDGSWDSGVFLEAGSFASAGPPNLTTGSNFGGGLLDNDSTVYEGCGFAYLLVDRGLAHTSTAETFHFSLSGTADNGLDYSSIIDSINFAIGQDTASVKIISLPDLLIEGTETVLLSLFATSTCGGSDTLYKTIYIIDTPPLKVSLNDDTSLMCPPENLFLTATTFGGVAIGSYSYSWTNSSGTKDTIHINPSITTTYIVTVTDSCGNIAIDSCTVNFVPYIPMELKLNNDTTICGGRNLFIDAEVTGGLPNYKYLWSPNITSLDSFSIQPQNSAIYILTVEDNCGFIITDSVNITVYPINANFQYTFTTNQTLAFDNSSSGAVSYYWNFGDNSEDSISTDKNPQHFYINEGTYVVKLISTNQNDCSDTTSQTIIVLPDFYFYYPNAFSPNKNEKNDFFSGYGAGIKSYRMRIFNRWGQLVFETFDIRNGWDGTYKGETGQAAVYICTFDLESASGKKITRTGSVTLVR